MTKIAATYSGNKGHENGLTLNKASLRSVYGISHGIFPSIEMILTPKDGEKRCTAINTKLKNLVPTHLKI